MKLKLITMALVAMCFAAAHTTAVAQCKEFIWPENRAKADESVALWSDAIKQGHYRSATPGIQWMLANAPKWNTKLYIDGADIYDKLTEKETDPTKKKVLLDSLMMIYDMRIQNCGDEVNVTNRKVYASYKYNFKSKENLPALLAAYDKVFEMSGNKVTDGNLVAYMTVVKNNQTLFKNLTDEQILARYDKIIAVTDAKIAAATKPEDVTKLKGFKDAVDGILTGLVKVDCDFVKKNLAPKFKQNPDDLGLAKKIFNFMLQGKCTDDPLWLESLEAIDRLNTEKDFGLKKTLAGRYLAAGDLAKAAAKYKEALEIANNNKDKSEATMYLGMIESKNGNYASARETYRQAASLDASNKEAYEKIGDLYYNSFDNCSKKQSQAEDRLIYIAAYDMYQRAGNSQLMSRAKAQFPSKEDIFLLNWLVGSNQQVKCWINETVSLRTRD
ncbi:MAG: tetratricopeptide repeat protein [Cyclobacteriaceae bacterium]|nr:tetratricopeptide repeat protein [Cyclobacteriaceae bacterium]